MSVDYQEVLARLRAEAEPISLAKLKKAFGGKKAEAGLLEALAGPGIYRWPKDRYWHCDAEAQLREEILAVCGRKASKKTEIKVKGRGMKEVSAAVARLEEEKKLLEYPPLAGRSVLLVTAGAPQAYWEYVKEVVAAKLKKAGIEDGAGLEEKIWEILPQLEPEMNVPVSTARVRSALGLTPADKKRFDEAALDLAERRRVYLSGHDHAQQLSEEDRELLIEGKDGRYYVAISRRAE